jgi:hypothetical protein
LKSLAGLSEHVALFQREAQAITVNKGAIIFNTIDFAVQLFEPSCDAKWQIAGDASIPSENSGLSSCSTRL